MCVCVSFIFFSENRFRVRVVIVATTGGARVPGRALIRILHGVLLLLLLWRPTAILFVIQRYATPWASLKHTRAQFVISPKKKKILLVKMKQKQKKKTAIQRRLSGYIIKIRSCVCVCIKYEILYVYRRYTHEHTVCTPPVHIIYKYSVQQISERTTPNETRTRRRRQLRDNYLYYYTHTHGVRSSCGGGAHNALTI